MTTNLRRIKEVEQIIRDKLRSRFKSVAISQIGLCMTGFAAVARAIVASEKPPRKS